MLCGVWHAINLNESGSRVALDRTPREINIDVVIEISLSRSYLQTPRRGNQLWYYLFYLQNERSWIMVVVNRGKFMLLFHLSE